MIERETIQQPRTVSVISRVVCDRCGGELRRVHGTGSLDREYEGSYVRGDLYPTQNLADKDEVAIDLCASCTSALREWVASAPIKAS